MYNPWPRNLEQSKGRYANHERAIDMFLQAHSIAGSQWVDLETSLSPPPIGPTPIFMSTLSCRNKKPSWITMICNWKYGYKHNSTEYIKIFWFYCYIEICENIFHASIIFVQISKNKKVYHVNINLICMRLTCIAGTEYHRRTY